MEPAPTYVRRPRDHQDVPLLEEQVISVRPHPPLIAALLVAQAGAVTIRLWDEATWRGQPPLWNFVFKAGFLWLEVVVFLLAVTLATRRSWLDRAAAWGCLLVNTGVLGWLGVQLWRGDPFTFPGPPSIAVLLPYLLVVSIFTNRLEVGIMARRLKTGTGSVRRSVAWANLLAVLVGCPLAWLLLAGLEILAAAVLLHTSPYAVFGGGPGARPELSTSVDRLLAVTLMAPWLPGRSALTPPGRYSHSLLWMIPGAAVVLLVPFCVVSYGIKLVVYHHRLHRYDTDLVQHAALTATLRSTLIAAVAPAVMLAIQAVRT